MVDNRQHVLFYKKYKLHEPSIFYTLLQRKPKTAMNENVIFVFC